MRILLSLSVLFIFQVCGFCQCKYEVSEIDAFTKQKKVVSEKVRFVSQGSFFASLQFKVDEKGKSLRIESYDRKNDCYSIETKILFRFKNGEVITLTNELNLVKEISQSIESSSGENIEIQSAKNENCGKNKIFEASLDDIAFNLFKNSALEKIRVTHENNSNDYEVKKKYRFKISKQINCIESALKQL